MVEERKKEEKNTASQEVNLQYDKFGDYDELRCDVCGMSYAEFVKTGVFGCENCYRVFKSKTVQVLKNKIKNEKELSGAEKKKKAEALLEENRKQQIRDRGLLRMNNRANKKKETERERM